VDYLERADPGLCRHTQLWIHGLIVFAHPRSSVDGKQSHCHPEEERRRIRLLACSPVPVLTPEDAVTAIVQAVPPLPLSWAEQERIVDLMAAAKPSHELVAVFALYG
jgi:hypothetical protein